MPSSIWNHQAITTSSFIGSIGVQTHMGYTDTTYANQSNVLAALNYVGIKTVRDGVISPASADKLDFLAKNSIKLDLGISSGGGSINLAQQLNQIKAIAADVPGSVIAIEAPNEVNFWPVTYQGLSGTQAVSQLQSDLYNSVKANGVLSGAAVYTYTLGASGASDFQAYGDQSGHASDANAHVYYGYDYSGSNAPLSTIAWSLRAQMASAPDLPVVVTETGYNTSNQGVSEYVQAVYTLDALFDMSNAHVAKTYLYELFDQFSNPSGSDTESHWGLFRADGTPKLVATALHNLTSILADPGSSAVAAPGSLAFSLEGLPSSAHYSLMQKSDGSYQLVIWNEQKIWDGTTQKGLAASASTISLAFGENHAVSVYDPVASASPTLTKQSISSLNLSLTDHPLIVDISPGSQIAEAAATSTITLRVSGDQYQGAPHFNVWVDNQLFTSADLEATAVHKDGMWNDVTISGSFGPDGPHTVEVDYNDDLSGSLPGQDRNLYVDYISVNGKKFEGETAAYNTSNHSAGQDPTAGVMNSSGALGFTINGSAPPDSRDQVSLLAGSNNVSEANGAGSPALPAKIIDMTSAASITTAIISSNSNNLIHEINQNAYNKEYVQSVMPIDSKYNLTFSSDSTVNSTALAAAVAQDIVSAPHQDDSSSYGAIIGTSTASQVVASFASVEATAVSGTAVTSANAASAASSATAAISPADAVSTTSGYLNGVYRFFDTHTGDHFYTTSAAEAGQIKASIPFYTYEGVSWATPDKGAGTQDVFRFFDTKTGTHFYTADAGERDGLVKTPGTYQYEGVAFQAYADPAAAGTGGITLERFFDTKTGQHHMAGSAAEAYGIAHGAAGPGWVDEGATFTVHSADGLVFARTLDSHYILERFRFVLSRRGGVHGETAG